MTLNPTALIDTGRSQFNACGYYKLKISSLQAEKIQFCEVEPNRNETLGKFLTIKIDKYFYLITIHVVVDDLMRHDLFIEQELMFYKDRDELPARVKEKNKKRSNRKRARL